jgi:hypothetical protein
MTEPAQTELAYQTRASRRPSTSSLGFGPAGRKSQAAAAVAHAPSDNCCSSCFGQAEAEASSRRRLHTTCLKIQPARRQVNSLIAHDARSSTLRPTGNSKVSRGSSAPLLVATLGFPRRRSGGEPVLCGVPPELGWAGPVRDRERGRQGQALETSDSHAALQARIRTDEQQPIRGMFQIHNNEVPSYQGVVLQQQPPLANP